jgi:hypothetical protein
MASILLSQLGSVSQMHGLVLDLTACTMCSWTWETEPAVGPLAYVDAADGGAGGCVVELLADSGDATPWLALDEQERQPAVSASFQTTFVELFAAA